MLAAISVIASITTAFAGDVIVEEGELNVSEDLIADTNTLYVDSTNDRVGIGTTSPATLLDVNGASNFEGQIDVNGNPVVQASYIQGATNLAFYPVSGATTPAFYFYSGNAASAWTERLRITGAADTANIIFSNSNVGIGTTGPDNPLHIYRAGANSNNLIHVEQTGAGNSYAGLYITTDDVDTELINFDDAFAGVPEYTGKSVLDAYGGALALFSWDAAGEIHMYTGGRAAGNRRVTIDSAGSVGIGTSNPNATLTIKIGGTTIADEWTVRSDRDIKTDITELNVDDFDFSKASLYKYRIKYQEPIYEEIDGELIKIRK